MSSPLVAIIRAVDFSSAQASEVFFNCIDEQFRHALS